MSASTPTPEHRSRRVSIRTKIGTAMAIAAVVPLLASGYLAYRSASGGLIDAVSSSLEAVAASRAGELTAYSDDVEAQVQEVVLHRAAVAALADFGGAFDRTSPDTLTRVYGGSAGEMTDGGDGSDWTTAHATHHALFRDFQERFGYYDIFLVDPDGDVVYTVFKEPDFATNLVDGPYADSGLGAAVAGALAGELTWSDYAAYAPSNGDPAAFVATPVYDGEALVGVLAFQMPIGRITGIVQETTGLGETGETYLVGPDRLMRSQSRFSSENTILAREIDTASVSAALDGESGTWEVTDYRDVPVVSSYRPIRVFGQDYVLIAEQDSAEAMAATHDLLTTTVSIIVVAGLLVAAGGVWYAGRLTRPVTHVASASEKLAQGATDITVARTTGDELGDMIDSVSATISYLKEAAEAAERVAAGDLRTEVNPRGEHDTLGRALSQMIESLRSLVTDVRRVSDGIGAASDSLAQTSEESAQIAEDVAASIGTVAATATNQAVISESLAAAVDRINIEVATAAAAASSEARSGMELIDGAGAAMEAITHAFDEVATSVSRLEGQFTQVEEIVALIGAVAEQTNLLALNAAIEAARAGELGRGFAVVASEVKALAEESSTSTDRIASIVGEMKAGMGATVHTTGEGQAEVDRGTSVVVSAREAFKTIAESVTDIDEGARSVAEATERIGVASADITTSAGELASLTESNGAAAEEVAAASEESSATAGELGNRASELAAASRTLIESLAQFRL
jgi:methyl-accepting chemotaxis protein